MGIEYIRPNQAVASQKAQQAAERESRQSGVDLKFISPKTGQNNRYRILPPWDSSGLFGLELFNHWNLPNSENRRPVRCLKTWKDMGVPCPICEVLEDISKRTAADLSKFESRPRAVMNVLDREAIAGGEAPAPKILDLPIGQWNLVWRKLAEPAYFDALDPMKGGDLIVYKSNDDPPKYTTYFLQDPSVVGGQERMYALPLIPGWTEEQIAELLKQTPHLNRVYKQPDAEGMEWYRRMAQGLYNHLTATYGLDASQTPPGLSQAGAITSPPVAPPAPHPSAPPAMATPPAMANPPTVTPPVPAPNPTPPAPTVTPPAGAPTPPPITPPAPALDGVGQTVPKAPKGVEENPHTQETRQHLTQMASMVSTAQPPCFGGAQPHEMGIGFNAERSECKRCMHEVPCIDTMKARGQNA